MFLPMTGALSPLWRGWSSDPPFFPRIAMLLYVCPGMALLLLPSYTCIFLWVGLIVSAAHRRRHHLNLPPPSPSILFKLYKLQKFREGGELLFIDPEVISLSGLNFHSIYWINREVKLFS